MDILLLVLLAIALPYWLVMLHAGLRCRAVKAVAPASDRRDWPSLSVIVPACNEEAEIGTAARSLLAQDYPGLEIIFVDDRSSDITGAILDALAASDPRAKVLHIRELPDGWLGKVHALHEGLSRAGGALALFTDADVHFKPGCLRAAVDHLLRGNLDHLAGFPRLRPAGLVLGAMIAAFLRQFFAVMRPWKVPDARSRAFIGVGAFNLVRREAFSDAGGFEWLRMEVGDDVAVGLMMKRRGLRCGAAGMASWIDLYWHSTVAQAMRGAEKGWSTVCRFSLLRGVSLALATIVLELAPLWGLVAALRSWGQGGLATWVAAAGGVLFATYLATTLLMAGWMRQRFAAHLLSIFTAPLSFATMFRAAVLGKRRDGALWRGTLYTTRQLREGMRVKFPW